MPIINKDILAASVATPVAGNTTLFTDAGLAYIKQSSGTVLPIGGLTPSGVTAGSYTTCDLTVDANGIITAVSSGVAGGAPGGSDTFVQYNSYGAFAGVQDFRFDQYGMGFPAVFVGDSSSSGGVFLGPMVSIDRSRVVGDYGGLSLMQANGTTIQMGNPSYGTYGLIVGSSGSSNNVSTHAPLTINDRFNSSSISGTATLTDGTVTVSNTFVTTVSQILVTVQTLGTVSVPKAMYISARTDAIDFTITSADATDTSTVAWFIIN